MYDFDSSTLISAKATDNTCKRFMKTTNKWFNDISSTGSVVRRWSLLNPIRVQTPPREMVCGDQIRQVVFIWVSTIIRKTNVHGNVSIHANETDL